MHEHNFLTTDFYNVIATSNSPLGMILLLTIVTLGGILIDSLCRPIYTLLSYYITKSVENGIEFLTLIIQRVFAFYRFN